MSTNRWPMRLCSVRSMPILMNVSDLTGIGEREWITSQCISVLLLSGVMYSLRFIFQPPIQHEDMAGRLNCLQIIVLNLTKK